MTEKHPVSPALVFFAAAKENLNPRRRTVTQLTLSSVIPVSTELLAQKHHGSGYADHFRGGSLQINHADVTKSVAASIKVTKVNCRNCIDPPDHRRQRPFVSCQILAASRNVARANYRDGGAL